MEQGDLSTIEIVLQQLLGDGAGYRLWALFNSYSICKADYDDLSQTPLRRSILNRAQVCQDSTYQMMQQK